MKTDDAGHQERKQQTGEREGRAGHNGSQIVLHWEDAPETPAGRTERATPLVRVPSSCSNRTMGVVRSSCDIVALAKILPLF